ncbi:MAG: hypothetical protein ACUVTX_10890, partial [Bacteroidales bacterium]
VLLSRLMKNAFNILLFSITAAISCTKYNYRSEISFEITDHLLKGEKIRCIEIDCYGNLYAGGEKLYIISRGNIMEYDFGCDILSLSSGPEKTLWIGTAGKGLACFDRNVFKWYNKENSGFPRDYIGHVEVAPDGKVWFSSCANNLGGLGIFDGKTFEFLTPENSPLNQNVISDLEIGDDGSVYIATSGKVGRTNIYRITGKKWQCLGDENGTFYWVFNFTVSPSGLIYLVEDFSLSSTFRTNRLFSYVDNRWHEIEMDIFPEPQYSGRVKADMRDYCWLAGSYENSAALYVYNGEEWIKSPEGLLTGDFITVIENDYKNNIYIGTYANGIFIINQ